MKKKIAILSIISLCQAPSFALNTDRLQVKFSGSKNFKICQALVGEKNFLNLVDPVRKKDRESMDKYEGIADYSSRSGGLLASYFLEQFKSYDGELELSLGGSDDSRMKSMYENFQKKSYQQSYYRALYQTIEVVSNCELYFASISGGYVNYSNPEEALDTEFVQTADQKIKCRSNGAETQDYPACKKLVQTYNAAIAGSQVTAAVQGVVAQGKAQEAQAEMAQQSDLNFTKGLELQKDNVKMQADMAGQRAAVSAGFATTMFAFLRDMPNTETIVNLCKDHDLNGNFENISKHISRMIFNRVFKSGFELGDDGSKSEFDYEGEKITATFNLNKGIIFKDSNNNEKARFFFSYNQAIPDTELADSTQFNNGQQQNYSGIKFSASEENTSDAKCHQFLTQQAQELLQNSQYGHDAAKQAMIEMGVKAVEQVAQSAILNSQADNIDTAIKKVDAFEPVDWTPPTGELTATECQANPEREGCTATSLGRTSNYTDTGLTITGGGSATISNGSGDNDSDMALDDPTSSSKDYASTDFQLGSAISNTDKGGDFETSPSAAATVKSGDTAQGGGGGGGGVGSVQAPPPAKTAGAQQKAAFVGKASKANYGGSSGGSLAYSGGGSRAKSKKSSSSSNPFDKLFNKKKANGNDVMNFRGLASEGIGGKNGSIFTRVSTRYGSVQEKGRLLEYEQVK
ncbi:hypothetical protein HBN50_04650 [Halobacteriovorax sp. GB3]|uniref:hypothetical protein n=1 Tax=Halobacteriovorax sp. GB3 TaxID=2719615 RepID=UPI002362A171|nr:hypothetical protein [Halobacteriovorax sp. GB3]MDD0852373.1 hypothetical protein [Halobacteriovorax sp. GB3]